MHYVSKTCIGNKERQWGMAVGTNSGQKDVERKAMGHGCRNKQWAKGRGQKAGGGDYFDGLTLLSL